MKRKMLMVIVVLLVAANVGCTGTSQERLDGLVLFLGMAKEQSELIDSDIVTLQQTLTDLQITADDPSLSANDAEKIKAALDSATEKLGVAVAVKAKVDKAVVDAEKTISEIAASGTANVGTEIEAAGKALVAVSPTIPPPFGVYAGIIGTLLAALGGVVAKRKNDALTEVVKSVDVAKNNLSGPERDVFVENIKSFQMPATRREVRKIRG